MPPRSVKDAIATGYMGIAVKFWPEMAEQLEKVGTKDYCLGTWLLWQISRTTFREMMMQECRNRFGAMLAHGYTLTLRTTFLKVANLKSRHGTRYLDSMSI